MNLVRLTVVERGAKPVTKHLLSFGQKRLVEPGVMKLLHGPALPGRRVQNLAGHTTPDEASDYDPLGPATFAGMHTQRVVRMACRGVEKAIKQVLGNDHGKFRDLGQANVNGKETSSEDSGNLEIQSERSDPNSALDSSGVLQPTGDAIDRQFNNGTRPFLFPLGEIVQWIDVRVSEVDGPL